MEVRDVRLVRVGERTEAAIGRVIPGSRERGADAAADTCIALFKTNHGVALAFKQRSLGLIDFVLSTSLLVEVMDAQNAWQIVHVLPELHAGREGWICV